MEVHVVYKCMLTLGRTDPPLTSRYQLEQTLAHPNGFVTGFGLAVSGHLTHASRARSKRQKLVQELEHLGLGYSSIQLSLTRPSHTAPSPHW